jgi:bromodomain-containing factor 1
MEPSLHNDLDMEVEDDKSNICPNFLNGNCIEIATCKWLHPGEVTASHTVKNETKKNTRIVTSEGVVNEELIDCLVLLEKLMDQEIAGPFNTPVDYKALNILDYPKIVKKPCDLGTIKELLLAGSFVNTMHFNVHVLLVFDNAILYNADEAPITVLAKQLKGQFERMFNEMVDKWKQEMSSRNTQTPEDMDKEKERERKELQAELDNLTNNIEKIKQELFEVRKRKGQNVNNSLLHQQGNVKRVKLTRPKAPLTVKQKEELVHKIGELEPEDYPDLINLADPNAQEDEEFQLNLTNLDDMTILNIQKYVLDCLKAKKRNKNGQRKKKDIY